MTETAIPLQAIALSLREAGMEISVKDLLEGITALEIIEDPFSYLAAVEDGLGDGAKLDRKRNAKRDRLVWLLQTLWARSENERDIVRRTIEREIGVPSASYALDLADLAPAADISAEGTIRPPSDEPLEDLTIKDGEEEAKETDAADDRDGGRRDPGASQTALVGINIPVPRIDDTSLPEAVPFALEERPQLDELSLAAVWRRFRQPILKVERGRPDIDGSIEATIRAGGQLTIVPALRRVNQARLLVLLDAGMAMSPWTVMRAQFEATLEIGSSRLEDVAFYYFSGVPGDRLYTTAALRDHAQRDDVLMDWSGAPMLVFGEAGSARRMSGDLEKRMQSFLGAAKEADIRPVVWINPMPPERWSAGFRKMVERASHSAAFPLRQESLIAAISVMREQAK